MRVNYYEILQVSSNCTQTEIIAAYHAAKQSYSGDSVATYMLMSAEEIQSELSRIEEAYQTLSHLDRRQAYDRFLAENQVSPSAMNTFTPETSASPNAPVADTLATNGEVDGLPNPFNGAALRELRTRRSLSLDDVARVTKIPLRFLKAIESDGPDLPARVYLQGFVKNLASVYKIPAQTAAKRYLEFVDSRKS